MERDSPFLWKTLDFRERKEEESQNEKPSLPQEHVLLAISLIQGQIFKKHDSCSYYPFIFFRMRTALMLYKVS